MRSISILSLAAATTCAALVASSAAEAGSTSHVQNTSAMTERRNVEEPADKTAIPLARTARAAHTVRGSR